MKKKNIEGRGIIIKKKWRRIVSISNLKTKLVGVQKEQINEYCKSVNQSYTYCECTKIIPNAYSLCLNTEYIFYLLS